MILPMHLVPVDSSEIFCVSPTSIYPLTRHFGTDFFQAFLSHFIGISKFLTFVCMQYQIIVHVATPDNFKVPFHIDI